MKLEKLREIKRGKLDIRNSSKISAPEFPISYSENPTVLHLTGLVLVFESDTLMWPQLSDIRLTPS